MELSKLGLQTTDSHIYIYISFYFLSVSPDGGLLQSSTVADSISFKFADGVIKSIPCSYIEFAERLVLPQFQNVPESEVSDSF